MNTKPTFSQIGTVGLTLVVIAVSILIFATAAQPMTDEADTVVRYVDALCAGDLDILFSLSAIPDGLSRETFDAQAREYLASGAIPQPCSGGPNVNLIRRIPPFIGIDPRVTEVRLFSRIDLYSADNEHTLIPIWVYRFESGEWRVRPDFLGPALQRPIPVGELASVMDMNNVGVGYVQIMGEAQVHHFDEFLLIGVPVTLHTLAQQWEFFDTRLFLGDLQTTPIDNADLLPMSVRDQFISARGSYIAQNMRVKGWLWYRARSIRDPAVMTFTVSAGRSAPPGSAFLAVQLPPRDAYIRPLNPFKEATFTGFVNENPVFDVVIDASELESGRVEVDCNSFVLETPDTRWLRATDCTFAPDLFRQILLPGERIRASVTFAGYNVSEAEIAGMWYRDQNENGITRFQLWPRP